MNARVVRLLGLGLSGGGGRVVVGVAGVRAQLQRDAAPRAPPLTTQPMYPYSSLELTVIVSPASFPLMTMCWTSVYVAPSSEKVSAF